MLIALELTNFKGVATRQRVEFAPLTLLFGANSAGKSTILQALAYLRELLAHGDADVSRTQLGGDVIELGGFARLVHRHDTNLPMILRAEFLTPGSLNRTERSLDGYLFQDLDDDIDRAWIEVRLQDRTTTHHAGPLVSRVDFGIGGSREPLLWLEVGNSLRDGEPLSVSVNIEHSALLAIHLDVESAWNVGASELLEVELDGVEGIRRVMVFAVSRTRLSALPPLDAPLRVVGVDDGLGDGAPDPDFISYVRSATEELRAFLELIILGTASQLASALERALYVGPLRAVPPRGFLFERAGRMTHWADGLAAWDLLLADRLDLVERTNVWLVRLGAGCQIKIQELIDKSASAEDLSREHVDSTVRRLFLDTGQGTPVLPSEVGAGISQIVPIVVAAIARERVSMVMLEQPEIHVHPALQVELGDLLVAAAGDRQLIVETHSEHLILRLLRRIRETTEAELPSHATPFTPEQLSVVYISAQPSGVSVKRLRIDTTGEFTDRWPRGFFEERAEELF
ncbi:MAG: AAA family ATPase [Myxococcales bacterium]|nr:AAA family ATPase [Myxococcales bacterium]